MFSLWTPSLLTIRPLRFFGAEAKKANLKHTAASGSILLNRAINISVTISNTIAR